MTPEEALAKAKKLVSTNTGPGSTSESRRLFHEHLITLPSYPSYPCKQLFGHLIHKHFLEFEDLQDKAVDAILDLCEDDEENTRIVGIKGLAATAKADPRWVRGNTGVLLQLLECPPRELVKVRESLHTLLSVAPADVFSVMADDCRGSVEETGASRRNIIDFLKNQCVEQRRDILESGKNLDAEKAFRNTFGELLDLRGGTTEKMSLLGMLSGLSTVSGKNRTEETTNWFAAKLVGCVEANSSKGSTAPLIDVFEAWLSKGIEVDPRWGLLFMARHGRRVLDMTLEGQDEQAKRLTARLKAWTSGAVERWKGKGSAVEEENLAERSLLPAFARTIITAIVDLYKAAPKVFSDSTASEIEILLFSVYKLVSLRDCREDVIHGRESRGLEGMTNDAMAAANRVANDSALKRIWGNIRAMTEILEDAQKSLKQIFPSWEPLPLAAAHTVPKGPRSEMPTPSGSSAIRPAAYHPRPASTHLSTHTPSQPPRAPRDHPPHRPAPSGPSSSTTSDPARSRAPTGPRERTTASGPSSEALRPPRVTSTASRITQHGISPIPPPPISPRVSTPTGPRGARSPPHPTPTIATQRGPSSFRPIDERPASLSTPSTVPWTGSSSRTVRSPPRASTSVPSGPSRRVPESRAPIESTQSVVDRPLTPPLPSKPARSGQSPQRGRELLAPTEIASIPSLPPTSSKTAPTSSISALDPPSTVPPPELPPPSIQSTLASRISFGQTNKAKTQGAAPAPAATSQTPATPEPAAGPPSSLGQRLAPKASAEGSTGSKRVRDENLPSSESQVAPESAKPSLLSRLGRGPVIEAEDRLAKKVKASPESSTPSLISRIGGTSAGGLPTSAPPPRVDTGNVSFTSAAAKFGNGNGTAPISILNRSKPAQLPVPAPVAGLSIRKSPQPPAAPSRGLSIAGRSATTTTPASKSPEKAEEPEQVVRKGRGFQKDQTDGLGDLIMFSPDPAATNGNRHGANDLKGNGNETDLAGRLGGISGLHGRVVDSSGTGMSFGRQSSGGRGGR